MSDHRFERTTKDIKQSFLFALRNQSFETITITQLAQQTLIDRTTFYAHYESIFELAKAVIDEQISLIDNILQHSLQKQHRSDFDNYQFFSDKMVKYIVVNAQIIKEIRLVSLGENSFDAQLKLKFTKFYQESFNISQMSFKMFLLMNFAMSDFDYILAHQRIPSKTELRDSLKDIESKLK